MLQSVAVCCSVTCSAAADTATTHTRHVGIHSHTHTHTGSPRTGLHAVTRDTRKQTRTLSLTHTHTHTHGTYKWTYVLKRRVRRRQWNGVARILAALLTIALHCAPQDLALPTTVVRLWRVLVVHDSSVL